MYKPEKEGRVCQNLHNYNYFLLFIYVKNFANCTFKYTVRSRVQLDFLQKYDPLSKTRIIKLPAAFDSCSLFTSQCDLSLQ